MNWISVKDKLPEKSSMVLINLNTDYQFIKYEICWFSESGKEFISKKAHLVTHWCELTPPEGIS